MQTGRIPPQNLEAEEAVLGALLLEKEAYHEVCEFISAPEMFYTETHQTVFEAIQTCHQNGQAIDMITVSECLNASGDLEKIGGAYTIARLTNGIVSAANIITHAKIVVEKYIQRELIRVGSDILSKCYSEDCDIEDVIEDMNKSIDEIGNLTTSNDLMPVLPIVSDVLMNIEEQKNKVEECTTSGMPSGFEEIDENTNGWQNTDLIILAARPSVGKTAFALNLAINATINTGFTKAVAIFSLEMGANQLVQRMMSITSGVPLTDIRKPKGRLEGIKWKRVVNDPILQRARIFIDDTFGLTVMDIRAKCRRLKKKHGLDMVIIDYIQLINSPKAFRGNREQEVSRISRELKGLAKDLDIPIIALSQLSRDVEKRGEKAKVPMLSDLRESGAIEQDADIVGFLSDVPVPDDEKDLSANSLKLFNIAKHRNGSIDSYVLEADLSYQKFFSQNQTFKSNDLGQPYSEEEETPF